ncbi:hypothetical protein BC940DRAFT_300356 [Gongronella butleri]|nr:hypothetical protein BC940DRAFT_300356 [Gongronella butleri]
MHRTMHFSLCPSFFYIIIYLCGKQSYNCEGPQRSYWIVQFGNCLCFRDMRKKNNRIRSCHTTLNFRVAQWRSFFNCPPFSVPSIPFFSFSFHSPAGTMGWVAALKRQYDMRNLDKYTRRRSEQSSFESRTKDYYDSVYTDGHYKHDKSAAAKDRRRTTLTTRLFGAPARSRETQSLATQQLKTSESYSAC